VNLEILTTAFLESDYYYKSKYDPKTFYTQLRNHTNFDIVSNAKEEEGHPIPEGLHTVGYLPQHEYDLFLVRIMPFLNSAA
jgi:alpha-1,3(6)-mannosylglycoprotein beta-1,6-N-acetyl-glucosaminyltransferase